VGHRDDFYVCANIVGITGPVNELPSVYFQNAAGEYGHITQVHAYDFNWGRTQVTKDPGWRITNHCPSQCGCGQQVSHEISGKGRVFHRSRSQFRPRHDLNQDELNVAAEAIYRCPYTKTDPLYEQARIDEKARYKSLWAERHAKGPGGRRGAIDYTGEGLANRVLKKAYPNRAR
jgi:hypothetical protein